MLGFFNLQIDVTLLCYEYDDVRAKCKLLVLLLLWHGCC